MPRIRVREREERDSARTRTHARVRESERERGGGGKGVGKQEVGMRESEKEPRSERARDIAEICGLLGGDVARVCYKSRPLARFRMTYR